MDSDALHAVILANGYETRLWPLSTPERPKQFRDLMSRGRTQLQETVDLLTGLVPPERTFVVINDQHADLAREQLPGLPGGNLLGGRTGGDAAGLAAALIKARHPGAVVANLRAGHHVGGREEFRSAITAAAVVAATEPVVAVIGVVPRYPRTGVDYIQTGAVAASVSDVPVHRATVFVENPSREVAEGLLRSGDYLWNTNLCVFHVNTDTARSDRRVVPGAFEWSDLGDWDEFYRVLAARSADPASTVVTLPDAGLVVTVDSARNLIVQTTPRPIGVVGLTDSVVVDTADGLLVARREDAPRVDDVAARFALAGADDAVTGSLRFRTKTDLSGLTAYSTFPFRPPVLLRDLDEERTELVRPGEDGPPNCEFCTAADDEFLWTDAHWRLGLHRPSALPGTVILHSRDHWGSLGEMSVDLAAEFGPLCARIERAILGLGTVGRVHLLRSGDGHAHFHVWFYARPLGRQQFRGAFLSTWAEVLRPQPDDEVRSAGEAVGRALAADQEAARPVTSSTPAGKGRDPSPTATQPSREHPDRATRSMRDDGCG